MQEYYFMIVLLLIAIVNSKPITLSFHTEKSTLIPNETRLLTSIDPLQTKYQSDTRTLTKLCLGTPLQCFDLAIQTNTFYLWVSDHLSTTHYSLHRMNTTASSTIKEYQNNLFSLRYDGSSKNIEGYQAIDTLTIGNTEVKDFNFILIQQSGLFNTMDGMIGLGYTPGSSDEFSLIHQLYKNNHIKQKVFSQQYTDEYHGTITIGEIPLEIMDNPKHYGRCKALDLIHDGFIYNNQDWQCAITGVFFGSEYDKDKVYEYHSDKVSFLSYRKRTFIPEDFYKTLNNTYFADYLTNGHCIRYKSKRYMSWKCTSIDNFPDLNIMFDHWVIKMSPKDLFIQEDFTSYLFILFKKKNVNEWVLGYSVLKNFLMVYDNQNEEIGFYNHEGRVFSINNNYIPIPPTDHEDLKKAQIEEKNKDIDISHLEIKKQRKFSNAFIIQLVFGLIIIIAIISISIIGFFSYRKYRRKNIFPSHDYFNYNAQDIIVNNQT